MQGKARPAWDRAGCTVGWVGLRKGRPERLGTKTTRDQIVGECQSKPGKREEESCMLLIKNGAEKVTLG